MFIERLWEEIRKLPARQRSAPLLNLRDPVAKAFAAVWQELPWSDKCIADVLRQ